VIDAALRWVVRSGLKLRLFFSYLQPIQMDATLHALSGLLLRAVPTFLLVIFLHFYLKYMFFKPLGKVLDKRYEATEGARQRAAESLEKAAAKIAGYEAQMRAARADVYQSQEQAHRRFEEEQAAHVKVAREEADASVRQAKEQLAGEAAQAKKDLAAESDALASQIAETILKRGLA